MSAVESWFAPAAAAVAEPLPRRSSGRASAASPSTLPAPRSSGRASAASPSTLPARPRPRRAPATARPKAQQRQGQRRAFRVRAPLVWMVVFAVLLVGVVAVNVAVLRAHVAVNDLDTKIGQLQQATAKLSSQYASATAAPRVEAAAHRAHLVPAPGIDTTLLDLDPRK